MPSEEPRPVSALPSVKARVLAFSAIMLAGIFGAMIGYAFVDIQCEGDCSTGQAVAALIGAVVFALGVGVVAVLTLRAMGEWRRLQEADDS